VPYRLTTANIAAWAADVVSAAAIIGSILGYLPYFAALAGLVWYCIQIRESKTVQHWLENRRMVQRAKKIAKLRAKEKVIVAELEAMELSRHAKIEARDKVELARVEAAKQSVHDVVEQAVRNDESES